MHKHIPIMMSSTKNLKLTNFKKIDKTSASSECLNSSLDQSADEL